MRQVAALSTELPGLRLEAERAGLRIVGECAGSRTLEPTHVSTRFLREIRRITGVADPFAARKAQEIALAHAIFSRMSHGETEDLGSLLRLAVAGNGIDFFRSIHEMEADLGRLPPFAVDHTSRIEELLLRARKPVVVLADNAGELVFDLPLLGALAMRGLPLVLGVKGAPSQNDLTLQELGHVAPSPYPFHVVSSGTDAVGTQLGEVSPAFRGLLEGASLIIAKGMANFESLRGEEGLPPVAYCFIAKCAPNARYAGVSKGDRVVLLSEGGVGAWLSPPGDASR